MPESLATKSNRLATQRARTAEIRRAHPNMAYITAQRQAGAEGPWR
jgi:hypothetical protein